MRRSVTVLGRAIPLGIYTTAVKRAIAAPATEFKQGLTTWWPTTGAEIRRQFLEGVEERINAGVPYSKRGIA